MSLAGQYMEPKSLRRPPPAQNTQTQTLDPKTQYKEPNTLAGL